MDGHEWQKTQKDAAEDTAASESRMCRPRTDLFHRASARPWRCDYDSLESSRLPRLCRELQDRSCFRLDRILHSCQPALQGPQPAEHLYLRLHELLEQRVPLLLGALQGVEPRWRAQRPVLGGAAPGSSSCGVTGVPSCCDALGYGLVRWCQGPCDGAPGS